MAARTDAALNVILAFRKPWRPPQIAGRTKRKKLTFEGGSTTETSV
jgi:hypothetical protein